MTTPSDPLPADLAAAHAMILAQRELLTLATLIGSVSITLTLWVVGYLAMGGPR